MNDLAQELQKPKKVVYLFSGNLCLRADTKRLQLCRSGYLTDILCNQFKNLYKIIENTGAIFKKSEESAKNLLWENGYSLNLTYN